MVIPAGHAAFHLSSVRVNRVQFSVREDLVGRLSVGTVINVTIEALGISDLYARITAVSGGGSQQGALFPVTAMLRAPLPPSIRASMSATVSVDLPVPQAVQEDEKGRFVSLW
jgi:hypothetical protein